MNVGHWIDVVFNVIVFAFIGVTIWLYLRSEETDIDAHHQQNRPLERE